MVASVAVLLWDVTRDVSDSELSVHSRPIKPLCALSRRLLGNRYLIVTAFELGTIPAHYSRIVMPATASNRC